MSYPLVSDDPIIQRICERAQVPPHYFEGHANCSFGGLGCLYWLVDENCEKDEHPNVHPHAPGEPCGLGD